MHSKRMQKSRGVPRFSWTRGKEWIFVPLFLVCLLAFTNSPAWSQGFVGSVTGVVTDPTGAVVPGATVTLTDSSKGYDYHATTDSVGRYVIRQLPPSTYQLKVEAQGFRTYVQEGVVLAVAQSSSVDVGLELGATAQSVEVVGTSPVLSTQDSAIGQDISRTFINDLPLLGRNVFNLALLAPGVSQAPNRTYGGSGSDYATNFVSNGSRNATAEILIDGVTTTTAEPNTGINSSLYQPSVDAVQEFKMEQGNLSAEKGSSSNTQINMVMRSGTNAFHGSAWEYLRNDKLLANNWFNNRAGVGIPARRFNQFGATVGGPIIKDRTFFFFDYEGVRSLDATTASAGVPSAAMREGDFGEICPEGYDAGGICANPDHQIWDPYSRLDYSTADGGNLTIPIPFNNLATYQSVPNAGGTDAHARLAGTGFELPQVPGNLIDPTAYLMMQYFPSPNVGVGTTSYDRFNNWIGSGTNQNGNNQFDVRIDHRFSDSNLFNARFSYASNTYHGFNCFGTALDPCTQGPGAGGSRMFTMGLTHTFGPQTVMNVSYGITRWSTYTKGIAQDFPDFDPIADLGLPDYLRTAGVVASPVYYIYGGYGMAGGQSIGAQAWSVYRNGSEVHHLMAALNRIQGRHEFKFGGDVRIHRMNWFQSGVPGGTGTYDYIGTRQYPWSAGGGDGMASFLTGSGFGGWGEYDINAHMSTQSPKYDLWFQDNWRATDKLTIGLGLRYDLEIPRNERYNRMNWWDLTVPQPTLAVANPTLPAELPAGAALQQDYGNLMGGLIFASPEERTTADTDGNNFGPRISIAYRVTDKWVIRSGYGLFYNPSLFGTAGGGQGGIDGFQRITNWRNTFDNDGLTIWGRPSNPFPDGIYLPLGDSLGILQQVGSGSSAPLRYRNATAYTQTWSFGIQRELPGSILVDASYVGTKGTKLNWLSAGEQNFYGPWIETATADQIDYMQNTTVANPFYGVITEGDLSAPNVGIGQLLMAYPQFTSVNAYNTPWANSDYHAFQLKVDKRFSKGLQFLLTYTNSKTTDDGDLSTWTGWLGGTEEGLTNPNNRALDHGLSEADISQIFQVAYVYQLPWGRGKRWGANWNSVVDAFLGGWQTNGIWRFDTGQPIKLGCDSCTAILSYDHQRPNVSGTLEKASGTSGDIITQFFANPEVTSRPDPYTLGNAPRLMPNIRRPGTSNAALSIFKEISLNAMREGSRLEFRAEAFNALNHPQFCQPNTAVAGPTFGVISSQCNSPREFQMALKLYW